MRDLGCVIHCHSRHSDGTGTVAQMAAAARRAGADAMLLTDHDTLAARALGEDGVRDGVLVITGHEVTSADGHLLAFGLDDVVAHEGRTARQLADEVRDRGGFGIAAHPWSAGNPNIRRVGNGMPWGDVDAADAVELWSIVTDSVEQARSIPDVLRFVAAPDRWLAHPPRGRLAAYDTLTAARRVVAIGGLDAHQVGVQVGEHVPLRLMGYTRTFRLQRTRVILDDGVRVCETAILGALRAGRCYLARDSLAPGAGFALEAVGPGGAVAGRMGEEIAYADDLEVRVRLPRHAAVTLRCDGEPVAFAWTAELRHRPERRGAYRIEALLPHGGRPRTWVVSNPVYLR